MRGVECTFLVLMLFSLGCLSMTNGLKELDLKAFKISIPNEWNYQKEHGEDSFVGKIVGPECTLFFDCSNMGYASSLLPTVQDYIKSREWCNSGYFYKIGVTYTADFNVKKEKIAQMKKLGITDSTLVHVEADPRYQTKTIISPVTSSQKIKFPNADYIAKLTYRDSTIYVPIELPAAIKNHNIQVDSDSRYVYKTIWPKVAGKGATGIYIRSRTSHQNFQMSGVNLSAKDQKLALQAFKTIELKSK